jgi:hypothetical protein
MERIEYRKTDGGLPKRVICHFDEFGQERFEEQAVGEDQFTHFTPSEEERHTAHRIRKEANKEGGILRLHHEGKLVTIDWAR